MAVYKRYTKKERSTNVVLSRRHSILYANRNYIGATKKNIGDYSSINQSSSPPLQKLTYFLFPNDLKLKEARVVTCQALWLFS